MARGILSMIALAISTVSAFAPNSANGQFLVENAGAFEIRASIADDSHWIYLPGVIDGEVVGFLAVQDPMFVENRNSYSVVWFERVGVADFSMEGWTSIAPAEAANIVADRFEVASMFQYANFSEDAIALASLGAVSHIEEPEATNHGISIYDPWQEISAELSPEDIEFLVAGGLVVGAPGLSGRVVAPAPCEDPVSAQDAKLAIFAASFEEYMFGAVSAPSELPSTLAGCCTAVPQWCITTYAWGPWSGPESISSAAPACKWTRNGTQTDRCFICFITWTTTTPVTDNRVCSTATAGDCPPLPTCSGMYP